VASRPCVKKIVILTTQYLPGGINIDYSGSTAKKLVKTASLWLGFISLCPVRFKISENGGLEEFEEFLESLATFSASSVLALRSSATCYFKAAFSTCRSAICCL